MRRSRRKHSQFDEPSLVPLADMLTNTVGIMVFILIFTVLTAGAVVFAKRLPMERESHVTERQSFICANNRIYPLREATVRALVDKIRRKFDTFSSKASSVSDLTMRAKAIDKIEEEDQDVHYCVNASVEEVYQSYSLEINVVCEPKPGKGTSTSDVARTDGAAGSVLASLKPEGTGVIFWVKPDSVPAFLAARDYAAQLGFACTWLAEQNGEPITFPLTGGGGGSSDIFKGQN